MALRASRLATMSWRLVDAKGLGPMAASTLTMMLSRWRCVASDSAHQAPLSRYLAHSQATDPDVVVDTDLMTGIPSMAALYSASNSGVPKVALILILRPWGLRTYGDGELNGNGLETSMDVEFRVEVLPNRPTPSPRVENDRQIMALGYEGSLNEALRTATSNMQRWLASDYALNPSEAAQVIGTAAHIRISEAADRNAGVALILDKEVLRTLTK